MLLYLVQFVQNGVAFGNILPDGSYAFLEGLHFCFGQLEFQHLFYAVLSDYCGHTGEDIPFTVFPVQFYGAGRIRLSSWKMVRTRVAAAEAMPYSVHHLPDMVIQPP